MKRFQPYLPILWTLVLDLAQLTWRVGQQVILPGRKKTGNLLTSLFLLFEGLIEPTIRCRRSVIRVAKIPVWTQGKLWLRRGMLVAAWALFILTSFEWSGGATGESRVEYSAQTIPVKAEKAATVEVETPAAPSTFASTVIEHPHTVNPRTKRWLLLRMLRI